MPTEKPRKQITIDEADLHRLESLRVELQSPARKGSRHALPLRATIGELIVKLALERAAQVEADLRAERAAARRRS